MNRLVISKELFKDEYPTEAGHYMYWTPNSKYPNYATVELQKGGFRYGLYWNDCFVIPHMSMRGVRSFSAKWLKLEF